MLESISGERTTAEIARSYDVNPNLIGRWKQELVDKGHEIFDTPTAENNPYKKIEELEKIMAGSLSSWSWQKTIFPALLLPLMVKMDMIKAFMGSYGLNRCLGILGVAKSTYYYQCKRDEPLLKYGHLRSTITKVIEDNPAYGFSPSLILAITLSQVASPGCISLGSPSVIKNIHGR